MPLMGSLYIGQSGLQTSQNALNTVAHNLSNIDTQGYTRQQVSMTDKEYNFLNKDISGVAKKQTGLGVTYSETRQVRDQFLDSNYRRESGRNEFYQASYDTIVQVESLMGEMYGTTFSEAVDDLYTAVSELAKTPSDSVVQGLFIQRCSAFLETAQSVYSGLCSYQDNINLQIKEKVDRINELGKGIKELNDKIMKIESGGFEHANDLRDTRNSYVDELAGLVNINYETDFHGNTIVQIEGHDFVAADLVFELGLYEDTTTGFYTPFWEMDAKYTRDSRGVKIYDEASVMDNQVFNLNQTIKTELNTDIGGLKALMWARGDHRANYTDVADPERYDKTVSQSVLMNIQAEFDNMVHYIATSINDIINKADPDKTGYLCTEEDGMYKPIQVFTKVASNGYKVGSYTDKDGYYVDPNDLPTDATPVKLGWYYQKENYDDIDSLYTCANLTINGDLLKQPTLLNFMKEDGKEDRDTPQLILDLFTEDRLKLNPNVTNYSGITDYYSDLVSQISNSGFVYKGLAETQSATVDAIGYSREELLGVSSDDELTQMIRYQNGYNAASRYINVINEMLEHLVTSLT